MNEPKLGIQVGFSSLQGLRDDNQDFGGFTQPGGMDSALLGYVAAVAAGMATTFSASILRQQQAHLIHVGDSRIYRLREEALEKLTEDHNFKHPDNALLHGHNPGATHRKR